MSQPPIQVFVLAAPGRPEVNASTRGSLEASDIGENYVWCENPPGVRPIDHWSATFDRMAKSESPLVILLEDDCLVNRHILSNVMSWKWPHDPSFGAGWLYNPGGYCGGHDVWYNEEPAWYGSVGVLYWTRDVPRVKEFALAWMGQNQSATGWDCAAAWAVWWMKKKIRVHGPPLVEHQLGPSLLDHQHSWSFGTSRGTYQPEWKRGNPLCDPNALQGHPPWQPPPLVDVPAPSSAPPSSAPVPMPSTLSPEARHAAEESRKQQLARLGLSYPLFIQK